VIARRYIEAMADGIPHRPDSESRSAYLTRGTRLRVAPELAEGGPLGELVRDPEDSAAEHASKRDLFAALLASPPPTEPR